MQLACGREGDAPRPPACLEVEDFRRILYGRSIEAASDDRHVRIE
jgi:hypothetical protein